MRGQRWPVVMGDTLAALAGRTNLRLVRAPLDQPAALDIRTLPGGALVQDPDAVRETREGFDVASSREPTDDEWDDLLFAWTIAWRVKSNTIVFARDRATVGIGAGQMSRVDSSWIAARKAGDRAKGAVVAMTRQLAVDYAQQVRVNCICPGTVDTPFVEGYLEKFHKQEKDKVRAELHQRQPVGRMGRPEEIASLVLYLCSDEAAFVTGSIMTIDGGWTAA